MAVEFEPRVRREGDSQEALAAVVKSFHAKLRAQLSQGESICVVTRELQNYSTYMYQVTAD